MSKIKEIKFMIKKSFTEVKNKIELTRLIDNAISDGILTDEETTAILEKAQESDRIG